MTLVKRPFVPVLTALFAAAAFAALTWLAAPAHALDDTKPTPTCAGPSFTDPKGDAAVDLLGVGLGILPAPDNMDITGGFFKYDADASGTASLTANITVANLTKDVPAPFTGVAWYYFWQVGGTTYWVQAAIDSAGAATYSYGDVEGILQTQGMARGKMFEGPDGVIQIAVPQAATGAKDGAKLTGVYASSRASLDIPGVVSYIPTADDGPDSQAGKNYTVAQCPGAGPAAGNETGTTPASTTLPIKLLTSSAKAAKGKKGKSLSFKLQSTEQVTGLKGTLKKGSTTYGTGKLASLNGKGTLKMKLKKALKKGSYKLQLSGSTAGGARKATFTVKVS